VCFNSASSKYLGSFAVVATAVCLLLIFALNMWLAFTALQGIATGIVRMHGRSYRRERDGYEFWFSIAAKAAAAIIFFLYLTSIVRQLSQLPASAKGTANLTKKT
jgi:hypothetical protein